MVPLIHYAPSHDHPERPMVRLLPIETIHPQISQPLLVVMEILTILLNLSWSPLNHPLRVKTPVTQHLSHLFQTILETVVKEPIIPVSFCKFSIYP